VTWNDELRVNLRSICSSIVEGGRGEESQTPSTYEPNAAQERTVSETLYVDKSGWPPSVKSISARAAISAKNPRSMSWIGVPKADIASACSMAGGENLPLVINMPPCAL